jgi:hypothetical protein
LSQGHVLALQTRHTADAALGDVPSDRRRRRSGGRRRQPSLPPTTQREEDEEEARPGDDDEMVRQTNKEEGAHEGEGMHEEDGTGSASSGSSTVYLRGPASLPLVPLPHQRPMSRPEGQK